MGGVGGPTCGLGAGAPPHRSAAQSGARQRAWGEIHAATTQSPVSPLSGRARRDIPAEKVARRLHLTPAQFDAVRARLVMRGFPRPDPDTGIYCLEAIDRWRHLRHPSLFPELVALGATQTPAIPAPAKSMGELAREGEERRRQERMVSRERAKPLDAIDAEAEQKRRDG